MDRKGQHIMAQSEVAQLRQRLADEYQAAQWGLTGLAYGTSKHQFITAKMENMGKAFETLTQLVGSPEEAGKIVAETLKDLPDTPTRGTLLELLRRELDHTEEVATLIERIQRMWEIIDMLSARFGVEPARKIMETPSSWSSEGEGMPS
jgi:flagellin-specific chaperone FliS